MSELTEKTIEHVKAFYYVAGIVCVAGAITLFFYPPQGIGIILFGGFFLYWALENISIASSRDINEKLSEIASYLDEMRRKDSAGGK
jgi:hypothetical protein